MSNTDLESLITGAKAGQAEAFDQLIDAYADRMFGYLIRMTGSRTDAEDLLQEVFVRLVKAIERYEHQNNFDAFLFRIASNLCRDRIRGLRRRKVTSLDADRDEAGFEPQAEERDTLPSGRLERIEVAARLQGALDQLPTAEKEVIMLRHFSDMSFKEIAKVMDTPLGTALARAHRGLAKLRTLFDGAEV